MARLSYIVTIISIALVCVCAEEFHFMSYNEEDTAGILKNDTIRDQYVDCFLDKSPCYTDDMKLTKEMLGEAILTNCEKCTEREKSDVDLIKEWFPKNKPEQWEMILAKSKEDMEKKNAGK